MTPVTPDQCLTTCAWTSTPYFYGLGSFRTGKVHSLRLALRGPLLARPPIAFIYANKSSCLLYGVNQFVTQAIRRF